MQNQHLDYFIDPSFQAIIRFFVLSFEDNVHQTRYNRYFFPTVEIKNYNFMIDGKKFFDHAVKK